MLSYHVSGKLIWCWIQMSVKIFLWTMLFWIPGIVALYRYRFASYNILTGGGIITEQSVIVPPHQTIRIEQ